MEKDNMKNMGTAVFMSLLLSAALPGMPVKAQAGQVTRVGEADRYETAAKVATTNWTSSENVVLVCGNGYADAVSASVLAKQLGAPILLTESEKLNDSTNDAITSLKPKNIYIVGGNASVSKQVRSELKGYSYNLIELYGKDRYATNVAVANELVKLGVKSDNVILVSGEGFSDALSVAPVAAAKGEILLLGSNDEASMKPVFDFVKTNNSKVTVVGTDYAINNSIYDKLGAVSRVDGGSDRFETNLNVLNEFDNDLNFDKLYVANASNDGYADALVASSLAGKFNSPLVLVDNDTSDATSKAIKYIQNEFTSKTDLNVIGGAQVVTDNMVSRINSAVANHEEPETPTVNSVTTNGLNQIRILFNTKVDENTAESIDNYQIDGSTISSGTAEAELQDDGKTVVITFANPYSQGKDLNFTVKNSVILDKNLNNTIPKFEGKVTFLSTSAPTLKSVTPKGGNKLVVEFSEPIYLTEDNLRSMKINRQSVINYGLDTSDTEFHNTCGSSHWTDKVELYFDSPLPSGTSTFTIPNGTLNKSYYSAAGFTTISSSMNFTVNYEYGTPKVTNVTADSSGDVYITYDRTMDQETALEDSNYKINGTTLSLSSDDISFESGSNDTIVKLDGVEYLLKDDDNEKNKIVIDNDIKDTYGNRIKETELEFTRGDSSVKPRISSVSKLNDNTIRIKFNKEVANSSATNRSNYTLIDDSTNNDVSYKISTINEVYGSGNDSNKTYDIKIDSSDSLKSSTYTLIIKNIMDKNSTPNVMDTYKTKISGKGEDGPTVSSVVKTVDTDNELVVFFDRTMDESSITNSDNYRYLNGNNETQKLPTSTTLTAGVDNKSVTIDFPSGYIIGGGNTGNYVTKLSVTDIKDADGNVMTSPFADVISQSTSNGPKIISNSSKMTFDGNDIKVKVSLTAPLDVVSPDDFTVDGEKPDRASVDGDDVILTFYGSYDDDDDNKVYNIKESGATTTVYAHSGKSADVAGRTLRSSSDTVLVPPFTEPQYCTANSNKSTGNNSTVRVEFNQNIDDDIRSSYIDDFSFEDETTKQQITPVSVDVDGDNVVYKFNNGTISVGDKIVIKANSSSSSINIRGEEHNSSYAVYSPSSKDLDGITITAK
ncbi:cell wall-binding repeat-containing protein [Clostridium fermenticellae]|uniref:Cell wall-binding repeat-containing protein n=1 Tax=Clostridium fermenticellae TaxID=2068654 RepID=A0A386H3M9_9CLOT|nr:cell wall-binding repeat-containing protein [Clostridium fermenticellae]AYD40329.1 cell wall-binding repeat-containing protein [Clostridium fermenticellae]